MTLNTEYILIGDSFKINNDRYILIGTIVTSTLKGLTHYYVKTFNNRNKHLSGVTDGDKEIIYCKVLLTERVRYD